MLTNDPDVLIGLQVFNRTNYDALSNLPAGDITGIAGHINGTTPSNRKFPAERFGDFEQGANRQLQIGIRLSL